MRIEIMRYAYIVPGGHERTTQNIYRKIGSMFRKKGFTVKYVQINWWYRTPRDWVAQLQRAYKPSKRDVFFGFSFGAWTSFVAATEVHVDRLILCSLSPYFKEDLPGLRKYWWYRRVGKRKLKDFENYEFRELYKKIKCKTILICGSKEAECLKSRVEGAHRKIKGSRLVLVKGSKHDISNKDYTAAISDVIKSL